MRKEQSEGTLTAGCIREYLEVEEITGSCKDYILRCENLDPHLLDYNSRQHCTVGDQHCEGTYYLNRRKNMGPKC